MQIYKNDEDKGNKKEPTNLMLTLFVEQVDAL